MCQSWNHSVSSTRKELKIENPWNQSFTVVWNAFKSSRIEPNQSKTTLINAESSWIDIVVPYTIGMKPQMPCFTNMEWWRIGLLRWAKSLWFYATSDEFINWCTYVRIILRFALTEKKPNTIRRQRMKGSTTKSHKIRHYKY